MNNYAYTAQNDDLGDLSTVSEYNNFDPLPAGDYPMQAISVDVLTPKSGIGRMVKVQFECLAPNFKGRTVFEHYSIQHANPQTVEIALRSIKQWAMACGYTGNERLTLALLKSLEGREFMATLSVEKDKTGQWGDKNRVRKFAKAGSGFGVAQAPMQAPAAPPAFNPAAFTPAPAAAVPAPAAAPAVNQAGVHPWMQGR